MNFLQLLIILPMQIIYFTFVEILTLTYWNTSIQRSVANYVDTLQSLSFKVLVTEASAMLIDHFYTMITQVTIVLQTKQPQ